MLNKIIIILLFATSVYSQNMGTGFKGRGGGTSTLDSTSAVTSFTENGDTAQTGSIQIKEGSNVTITRSGKTYTLAAALSGSGVWNNLSGFVKPTDAGDGVHFLDVAGDDSVVISLHATNGDLTITTTGGNISFDNEHLITTGMIQGGTGIFDLLDGSGAVDIDIGSSDITDVTITTDGGTVIVDGGFTGVYANIDTLNNFNNAATTNIVITDTTKHTALTASKFLVLDSNKNMNTADIAQGDLPSETKAQLDARVSDDNVVYDGDFGNSGILTRTGAGTYLGRTLTGDTEAVIVNGSGVSGNPTFSIGSTIARDSELHSAITYSGTAYGSLSGQDLTFIPIRSIHVDSSKILTQVQAVAGYQPLDADLTELAGISGVNGDIIIRNTTWVRLPKGSDGQVLKLSSGLPAWGTDATGAGGAAYADSVTHDGRRVVGDSLMTDAEGDARFQPLEATLTDIADGTIAENLVNTANPWAENEIVSTVLVESDQNAGTDITADLEEETHASEHEDSGTDEIDLQGLNATSDSDTLKFNLYKQLYPIDLERDNTRIFAVDSVDGSILTTGTVDGRDLQTDGTKLDGIEASATADQTAGEIEAIVNHDNLLGFVAGEHFLQSAISITESQVSDLSHIDATAVHKADTTGVAPLYTTRNYLETNYTTGAHTVARTDEEITDLAGGMVTGNTETGIAVTFQDADNTIDFVAEVTQSEYDFISDDTTNFKTAYTHSQDNTQAHSDYLLNSGSDVIAGTLTADGVTLGSTELLTIGAQTLTHNATDFVFNDEVTVPDDAYAAGWNGDLGVPTKNAVYDKIETVGGSLEIGGQTGATTTTDTLRFSDDFTLSNPSNADQLVSVNTDGWRIGDDGKTMLDSVKNGDSTAIYINLTEAVVLDSVTFQSIGDSVLIDLRHKTSASGVGTRVVKFWVTTSETVISSFDASTIPQGNWLMMLADSVGGYAGEGNVTGLYYTMHGRKASGKYVELEKSFMLLTPSGLDTIPTGINNETGASWTIDEILVTSDLTGYDFTLFKKRGVNHASGGGGTPTTIDAVTGSAVAKSDGKYYHAETSITSATIEDLNDIWILPSADAANWVRVTVKAHYTE